ncbi:MAG: lipid-A-disaccharide synthase [Deltaproteobacteria bacterium]|nr:lipid-A-disaccharide synthase [Deltaproteobacteria bacterium]
MSEAVRISSLSVNRKDRKLVVVVAGEASGDLHGANLVNALAHLCPEALFCGIGGDQMGKAGVERFVASGDMAVVGLAEIFGKFRIHVKAANILKSIFKHYRPDLLILVDYPGFNLYMARIAKKMKIPVLYYISPQVWAWRRGRVKKIAKRVDKMAVILPFEKAFFQKSGIDVDYVGHPLIDDFEKKMGKGQLPSKIRNPQSAIRNPTVGLVPGSRREEISNLLPIMIKAGEILKAEYPQTRFVLPLAGTIPLKWLSPFLGNTTLDIEIYHEGIYGALNQCHLAFVTSGTATLDAAIMNVPMVVVYKAKKLTYEVGKRAIKVPYLGLVNLVAGESVAPELIQDDVTPEKMAMAGKRFLADGKLRHQTIDKLKRVKENLGRGGASENTARIAAKMMGCSG